MMSSRLPPPPPSPSFSSNDPNKHKSPDQSTLQKSGCDMIIPPPPCSPEKSESSKEEDMTKRKGSSKFLAVKEIMDEQELGKFFLGLVVPMGGAIAISSSSLVNTFEMKSVVIALSLGSVFTWNGLFFRKAYKESSMFSLMTGSALMMLSFYSLLGLFLPLHLKWIPFVCWLASLIPFVMYGWAYFRREKTMKDPENGEI